MQMMRRAAGGLALVLAFAVLVAMGHQLSEKVDHFALARSDSDAWNFAQVEVAYNRFHLSLQDGLIELQDQGQLPTSIKAEILEQFNIFYSRVDTVAERYNQFTAHPDVEEMLGKVQHLRDGLTYQIDAGLYVTEQQLHDILGLVRDGRPSVRDFALAAMLAAIEDQEAEREQVHTSLRAAFLTLSVFVLVLLILGGFLSYLWRSLAKKNASERNLTSYLAKMIEVSNDGIVVVDRNLKVADFNHTAEQIFRQDRAAVLGRDAMAELAPRREHAAMAARLHALLDQNDATSAEMRRVPVIGRRGDGTLFPAELSVVRVRDRERRRVLVGFVRDLSPERNARRRTRRALVQARRDAAAKQRFLSTMSHEMRTPLHSIMVAADLADKADTASAAKSYLPKVQAATRTALAQVEEVLEVARNSEVVSPTTLETFDARAVTHTVFLQMQPLAAARGNKLILDWTIPATLHGVPRDLFRIVYNLVSNAVKATKGGTVTIRALEGELSSKPALLLEVADTGTGISAKHARHIFTDYVSGFRKQSNVGTGLGLGIVRKAVQSLNGRIDVDSTPGVGTTFRVLVPLSAETVTIHAAPSDLHHVGRGADLLSEYRPSQAKNILLVEDHATNRQLLTEMLGSIGYTVTAAENGLDGLRVALETPFDLILTDLNMPGLSGETIARCLRHSSVAGDTCIIAATARATMSESDQESIVAGSIDALLFKPFDSARLEAVISDALEERALSDHTLDETDATNDPEMLARSAQDLEQVLALLPRGGDLAEAPSIDELARLAHHAGGALLCIGHARLGHALLELERICGLHDREGFRGMTLVLDTDIKRFLAVAGERVAPA
ncbi:hybrid sensor histidine kinase/response regulator [Salibaculum griseiflavum]|uniref:histidine kinase n=1 Tax=Salibaculum griseiflavum TaxID=1914409 RepID=A0A2V1P7Y4_9RHOB|nr:ATP-binding protein [Salibaculum griseiflavum]PWG17954.1 hypothetical protein DFK10_04405 [Salibaculum griseiflavum]